MTFIFIGERTYIAGYGKSKRDTWLTTRLTATDGRSMYASKLLLDKQTKSA